MDTANPQFNEKSIHSLDKQTDDDDDKTKCPTFIIHYLKANHPEISLDNKSKILQIKSAQQQVFLLPVLYHETNTTSNNQKNKWKNAIYNSQNNRKWKKINTNELPNTKSSMEEHEHSSMVCIKGKIIARVWKGSARWWNLNNAFSEDIVDDMKVDLDKKTNMNPTKNESKTIAPQTHNEYKRSNQNDKQLSEILKLAKAEVAAYRLAKHIFNDDRTKQDANDCPFIFPDVLYFSHDTVSNRMKNDHSELIENENINSNVQFHMNPISQSPISTTLSKTKDDIPTYEKSSPSHPCWALFSYVGKGSMYFDDKATDKCEGNNIQKTSATSIRKPATLNNHSSKGDHNHSNLSLYFNDHLTKSMVKVRHEFGFDEPHPRHGRVQENWCLDYALQIIDSFLLPLHGFFFREHYKEQKQQQYSYHAEPFQHNFSKHHNYSNLIRFLSRPPDKMSNLHKQQTSNEPWTYKHMIRIYESAAKIFQPMIKDFSEEEGSQSVNEESDKERQNYFRKSDASFTFRVHRIVRLFLECVKCLIIESSSIPHLSSSPLSPVLCHLDLQPQNLMFCDIIYDQLTSTKLSFSSSAIDDEIIGTLEKSSTFFTINTKQDCEVKKLSHIPKIRCILDWEEAAFADPRFELLLICRKVCANISQAKVIWNHYGASTLILINSFKPKNKANHNETKKVETSKKINILGNIEPWLKLEGVHSILTMLSQLDILKQDPSDKIKHVRGEAWETKSDLINKIEREFMRLASLGWSFCYIEHLEK